jgi:hypothetical protein
MKIDTFRRCLNPFKIGHFYYFKFILYDNNPGGTYFGEIFEFLAKIISINLLASPVELSNYEFPVWRKNQHLFALDTIVDSYEVSVKDFPLYVGWSYISPQFSKILSIPV